MEQAASNTNQFCFAWYEESPAALSGKNRGALVRAYKWTSGDIISVSFLDGDEAVWDKVEQAARGWTVPGLANLKLDFRRDTQATDIRISFLRPGSWSLIGKTCKNVKDLSRPTMNYGWLKQSSSQGEVDRVVLHEFGHALGLIHEHQHPTNGIQWNKDAVYAALSGPPNHWSKEQIDFNMFQAFDAQASNFSDFDPESIMMYPFPAAWTLDGFSTSLNAKLSATDKEFIREQYP